MTQVLAGQSHYADGVFAAVAVGGVELKLHGDPRTTSTPGTRRWAAASAAGPPRSCAFGIEPDAVERRARELGLTVIRPATTKAHGWREVMVEDPHGCLWAVGVPTTAAAGR